MGRAIIQEHSLKEQEERDMMLVGILAGVGWGSGLENPKSFYMALKCYYI